MAVKRFAGNSSKRKAAGKEFGADLLLGFRSIKTKGSCTGYQKNLREQAAEVLKNYFLSDTDWGKIADRLPGEAIPNWPKR